jgi:hypothetical protein
VCFSASQLWCSEQAWHRREKQLSPVLHLQRRYSDRSEYRAGCKMRQCGPARADDKPQMFQDENLFHTVAIGGSGCRPGAVFEGKQGDSD